VSHILKEKRVLVIGLGISGQSAAAFLLKRGAIVSGVDRNSGLLKKNESILKLCEEGVVLLDDGQACDMGEFDLVVVSPGVPLTNQYCQRALSLGIEMIGEAELACRFISQKCVAITGTNGKTTVTLLVEHILNGAWKKARALGNIGIHLTSAIDDGADESIYVIELSSFQLETLKHSFIDAGVLLNITPDHLDRYSSMEAYALAKIQLKKCLKPEGKLFIENNCRRNYERFLGCKNVFPYGYDSSCFIWTDKKSVFINNQEQFTLPCLHQGKLSHDVENIMAAYALCHELGVSSKQFTEGLETFKKPSHRIEFVRTISGVHYVDDSKGTNIDAVMRAIQSLEGPIILIAGGVDKGFPYTPWIEGFEGKVKLICAIGESAGKIMQDLGRDFIVKPFSTLDEAVKGAAKMAKVGDTILLSPGCSSYDMFKDYAHRGKEFKRIVNALE
jgi:UDP-N-acetylmuramoylalanine--D-glutamate ligase